MQKKLFLWLVLAFITATVAGTITHECGHYITARCLLGHTDVHMSYAFTSNGHSTLDERYTQLETQQEYARQHGLSYNDKELQEVDAQIRHEYLLIIAAGPITTMLTGSVGLLLLFSYRRHFKDTVLNARQWILIMITLFWLRPIFNLFVMVFKVVAGTACNNSDEFKLERYLGLPKWSLNIVTGSLSLIVLSVVIYKFVPAKQRATFLAAGLIGGIVGYVTWFVVLGPVVMPHHSYISIK